MESNLGPACTFVHPTLAVESTMLSRHLIGTLLLGAAALPLTAPGTAQAEEAQSFYYEQQLSRFCSRPLKFAAGACVPYCPAGFSDEGGYCRLVKQNTPARR